MPRMVSHAGAVRKGRSSFRSHWPASWRLPPIEESHRVHRLVRDTIKTTDEHTTDDIIADLREFDLVNRQKESWKWP
jgi:hypothetical protein